ncbi:MAG TPA: GtrA family protein [Rhodospirillales bacterium]|nr:GtrA family protein [Rhodospirillales bacterium]
MTSGGELRGQIFRFLALTAASACLTLALPVFLHEILAVPENIAVLLSLITAFLFNFVVVRRYVFRSQGDSRAEFMRFALISAGFRFLEYVSFLILFNLLELNYVVALIIVLVTSVVFKFIVNRSFVFASGTG